MFFDKLLKTFIKQQNQALHHSLKTKQTSLHTGR